MRAQFAPSAVNEVGADLLNDEERGVSDSDESECDEEDEDSLNANHQEFQEFDWLEPLNGTVSLAPPDDSKLEHKHAGRGFGELIRRERMRYAFYDQLEQPSEDTSRLAFELFDRYGRLREEFKSHQVKKGSGIWGSELDIGDLLLIEKVYVEPEYRRQGLAQKLVKAMMEEARKKCGALFVVVLATAFNYYVDDEFSTTGEERRAVYRRQEQTAQRFFRSLGFRRIGSTDFFALAGDKDHACHTLSVEEDYNPPDFAKYEAMPQITAVLESAGPLHIPHPDSFWGTTVTTEEDRTLMNLEEQAWNQTIMPLFNGLALGHPLWGPLDCTGNTILHIAAMRFDSQGVQLFLGQNPNLRATRNYHGETPIEALECHLEEERTTKSWGRKTNCISDQFRGFSENAVKTLMKLRGLTHTTPIDEARLKYGCTCGQCLAGLLSPRMRFSLICQAEIKYDMLNEEIPHLQKEDWDDEYFEVFHGENFRYLEPHVRENLKTNKWMRQGFVNLFESFATCLNKDGPQCVPVPKNVNTVISQISEWPPYIEKFMERGGTFSSVGSLIFQLAKDRDDLAGDGEHFATFEDDITALPACRNDHEFGFVSGMCGYKRI